jgi:hypothetical protein
VVWLCLICGWIALFDYMGQRLICHHECLALLLYLVEGHKLLFVAKTFDVPNMNLKIKWKLLGKYAPPQDSFSDSYLVHEMSLREKGTYAPPQDKAWGLNIHDGK